MEKKKMNLIKFAIVAIFAALFVVGCKDKPNPPEQPEDKTEIEEIILDEDVYMYVGETYRLKYKIMPKDADISDLKCNLESPLLAELDLHDGYVDITGLQEGGTELYFETDDEDVWASVYLHIIPRKRRLYVWTPCSGGGAQILEPSDQCYYDSLGVIDGCTAICMELTAGDVFNAKNLTTESYDGYVDIVTEFSEDMTQAIFKFTKTSTYGIDELWLRYKDDRLDTTYNFNFYVMTSPDSDTDE